MRKLINISIILLLILILISNSVSAEPFDNKTITTMDIKPTAVGSPIDILHGALYPYPNIFEPGQTITFVYSINNPGTNTLSNVTLGARIRTYSPTGGWIDDSPNDTYPPITPGTKDYNRSYVIKDYVLTEPGPDGRLYDAGWVVLNKYSPWNFFDEEIYSPILRIVPKTTAEAYGPYSGYVNEEISFSGSATGGVPPLSYNWDFKDGSTDSRLNPKHTYSSAGTRTVTLTVKDNLGGEAQHIRTDSATVYVSYRSIVAEAYGSYSGNVNVPISFSSSATGGTGSYSYIWDFGDGSTGSGQNPTHSYTSPGTKYVTLIVTDSSGHTGQDTATVTVGAVVNQPPYQPSVLNQFRSDGTTPIATGTITNQKTVIFKGRVSDPDGDNVKLQIELRRTDEYGGNFDENQGGLKISSLVASGSEVSISVSDLTDASYHWRARAIDENGNIGDWIDFGGNLVSDADFMVYPEFKFAHITDTHLGYYIDPFGDFGYTSGLEKAATDFTDILQDTKNKNIDFIVVTGDLVQHRKLGFFMAFKNLVRGFNVYTTPGNHDRRLLLWGNDLTTYKFTVNSLNPVSPGEVDWSFTHKGYNFIGLDSGADYSVKAFPCDQLSLSWCYEQVKIMLNSMTPESDGLTPIQWMKVATGGLSRDNQRQVIFMHSPVMNYENDVFDGDQVDPDPLDGGPGKNNEAIAHYRAELIQYAINNRVDLVLTGHTHKDAIFDALGDSHTEIPASRPLFIQTRNNAYRIVDVKDGKATPLETTTLSEIKNRKSSSLTIWHGDTNELPAKYGVHAYDSQRRHTGTTSCSGDFELGIPDSYYTGNLEVSSEPEVLVGYFDNDLSAKITEFEVLPTGCLNGLSDKSAIKTSESLGNITAFNQTITDQTNTSTTETVFYNVTLGENSSATVNVSGEANYKMDIDLTNDGIVDRVEIPDTISTTSEQPQGNISIITYNGVGTINLSASIGNITSAGNMNVSLFPEKQFYEFPFGLIAFNISGIINSSIISITITLPQNLSTSAQYWKYGRTLDNNMSHWYQIPIGGNDGDKVIIIQLQDGGIGDDDGIANGIIVDAGGPGVPTDAIPIASVENLQASTGTTYLNFTWLNPPDPDFSHVMLYLNGSFKTNITAPQNYYNITGLTPDTLYELGTHTVDTSGNLNQTWVNATARTAPDTATPTTGPVHNINKGTNYTTIQAAINDSSPGDEIHVDSGNYPENVNVNKQLTLRGIGMPVVDARGSGSAITLAADGISLGGFTAIGGGNAYYWNAGINVISNNNTLSGNKANSNNNHGICLHDSSNNTLIDNNASSNNYYGIWLYSSYNNALSGNIANSNKNSGIYLSGSSNNTLRGNFANSNNGWGGIYLSYSSNNTLSDNIANSNNINNGIYLEYSSNNTLINNKMNGNKYNFQLYGSSFSHFDNHIDTTNLVDGKPVYYIKGALDTVYDSSTNAGTLYCISCVNITLINLDLKNNIYGIFFWNTTRSKIQNINTSNNYVGIYLSSSSNNTLIGNNASSNTADGIYLSSSNNNTLISNNASNNGWRGIGIDYSSSNMLSGNNASNNHLQGIFVYSSSNNTLSSNNATSNIYYGIYLYDSSNNTIYNNIFNNTKNFYNDLNINKWNVTKTPGMNIIGGSKLGGNFWANPDGTGFSQTCTDADGDGICDSSYSLDGNNVDYLPLAKYEKNINLIKNPGFENGKTNWTFYTNGTGNFTLVSPGYEGNNAANLTLTSNGTNIQLYQKNVTLEPKGIYRLSLAAYSTTGHDLKMRLFQHDFPNTDYGLDQTFDLGTNWQTFTTEFTAANLTTTVNDGRLMFYLVPFGEAGDKYYIDDVRLEKIGIDSTPPTVIGNTPAGNNVLADTPITVTFSEKMNQIATQLAFSTSPASNGSFYWKGTNMTYIPDSNLAYNTLYTVSIGTDAKDSAGNNLQSVYSWVFRTILPKPIINCTTISSPGVYALNVDIMNHPGTCINITSSNVIFDGTGHKIDGINAVGAYGVNVHNTTAIITNITVTNLLVTDWDVGIFLNNSNFNNITGNNISNSNTAGIKFYSSGSNTIYNNYFNNTRNFVFDGIAYQNTWNTTKRPGKNIIGGSSLGGNFWANSSGRDFSQTCPDTNNDGLCDLGYTLNSNNIDFLPLTSKPAEKWISVVSPNGGENWIRGTIMTINWTSKINTGPYVKIELLKAGVLNRVIIASTPNDGAHPWPMPATQAPGTDYKVRITSTSNASYTDISDNNFTVPVPTINITSPRDGDIWRRGTTQTVRWNSTGNPGPYVKIELLKPGVANKVIIASTLNDGSHPWLIPGTQSPGDDYKVKITSTTNASYTDTSDNNFTIPTPSTTVVSPNGGENWRRGTTQTIKWNSTESPGTYVKIELLRPGKPNQLIISATLNDGSHPWLIPPAQAPGSDYKMKITSTINALNNDTSDNDFTIPVPSITIVSPNGSENWTRGTTKIINWTSTENPKGYVKIELLKPGKPNQLIISATLNDGSHPWLIPAAQTPGSDYKMKITSTINVSNNDTSDGNFTIPVPSFTVVSPNGGESWTRGTIQTINWTSTESPGTYVKIELLKPGKPNQLIVSATLNDGSHPWLIPAAQAPGSDYKVKITGTSNLSYTDMSDNNYTINI